MKTYNVTIDFDDGQYRIQVQAWSEWQAYQIALQDARMASPAPIFNGKVIGYEVSARR